MMIDLWLINVRKATSTDGSHVVFFWGSSKGELVEIQKIRICLNKRKIFMHKRCTWARGVKMHEGKGRWVGTNQSISRKKNGGFPTPGFASLPWRHLLTCGIRWRKTKNMSQEGGETQQNVTVPLPWADDCVRVGRRSCDFFRVNWNRVPGTWITNTDRGLAARDRLRGRGLRGPPPGARGRPNAPAWGAGNARYWRKNKLTTRSSQKNSKYFSEQIKIFLKSPFEK